MIKVQIIKEVPHSISIVNESNFKINDVGEVGGYIRGYNGVPYIVFITKEGNFELVPFECARKID